MFINHLFFYDIATLSATAALGTHEINAVTYLQVSGNTHDGLEIKAGDCFHIKRPQPYANSLNEWRNGGGSASTFYSAFGSISTFTLSTDSSPDADIEKISSSELKITVKAGVTPGTKFDYKINSIVNPYSQTQNAKLTVLHYPACATSAASTPYQSAPPSLGK